MAKTMIESFINKYQHAGRSQNTIKSYEGRLNKLNNWLKENRSISLETQEDLKMVTGLMLEEWQMELQDSGMTPVAIYPYVAAVKAFFDWAYKATVVDRNPALAMIPPKIKRKEQVHLEWAQVERLMQVFRSRNETRDLCIMGIGFTMGLRNSAICGLNIDDVKSNTLVYTNKGGARLTAYIPEYLLGMINAYIRKERKDANPEDPLFLNARGNRITNKNILELMHKAGELIGVPELTVHAMRRSCLTRVSELNSIEMAQTIAAHQSSHTTERYVYQSEDNMRKLYEGMNILDFSNKE